MSSENSTKTPPKYKNFELVSSLSANDLIPVYKYVSKETGLTVVVSEVEGPVVNGYFCLATEAHDDDGLPHTLEHLIFLGSETYPYKGVLDLLANRCLASGTNAWTDTDHTCYTMTTAGSEGFLTLLPIYLDNILFPTLTDSGYVTEVYHINGEGRDGGVVYTEMQGRENAGESRVYLELMRSIYPGDCGYKYETGGIMKNLRESTTSQKCRDFHKKFYRPENLYLIIVGDVTAIQVLETVSKFEEKIISKGDRGPFVHPWQTAIQPLKESVERTVPFACDEEINGMVYIGWRGPRVATDIYGLTACSILLKYLTDTAVSPVTKDFVELGDPFASKVAYSLVENSESLLMIHFENVPINKLNLIKPRLEALFDRMLSSKNVFDMDRLETVINRHRLECLSHLESLPHDTVAYILIGHMLYGNSTADLDQRLNIFRDLERMSKEDESFWVNILKKYFVDGKKITIIGKPSIDEQKRITKEEEERVLARVKSLSSVGLELKEKELNDAFSQNEVPPPDEMLTSVAIPSVDSIHFHSISAFNPSTETQHPLLDTRLVPVYMRLDHLNTNFVYMITLMDSSGIDISLRKYFPLFLEMLLESPVQRGDTLVPYGEVVRQLERDTISASARIGLDSSGRFHCGSYCSTVALYLQLEPVKYKEGVNWMRELLFQTKFTPERVNIVAQRLINNVAEVKRRGNAMVSDLMTGIIYKKDSNQFLVGALRQHKFLTSILDELNNGNMKAIDDMELLRKQLTKPENIVVHMAANIDHLAKSLKIEGGLHSAWSNLLPENVIPVSKILNVTPDWSLIVQEKEKSAGTSCIAGVGAVESNFLSLTTPCLNDFNHPDLPALIVFLQYLTQLEGPMWKQIRGQGLSYNYNIAARPFEGVLKFTLFKASNVFGAYKEAKSVVEERLNSLDKWDTALFESAKSSVIFEIVNREKCISDVVAQSILSYFNGVSHNYNRDLIHKIAAVTTDDLKIIGNKYIKSLFDPKKLKLAVVCHPSKVEELAKSFNSLGVDLKTYNTLEDSFLNSW